MGTIRRTAGLVAACVVMLSLSTADVFAQGRAGGGGAGGAEVTIWERFSLDARGLDISRAQRRDLNRLLDAYNDQSRRIRGTSRVVTPEIEQALSEARRETSVAIGEVLSAQQREIWRNAVNERRAAQ